MAEQLGDLLVFVSIVAVLVVVGLLLGILVAGRIDKLMAPPRKPATPDAVPPEPATTPPAEDDQA